LAKSDASDKPHEVSSEHQHHAHHIVAANVINIRSSTLAQEETPRVSVDDQLIVDNTITVSEVVALQDGWAVVHTVQADGKPIVNQVVGSIEVKAGINTDVKIQLTESFQPNDELLVMLHIDEGTKGTLEFPSGPDAAVAVDDKIVTDTFIVLEAEEASHNDVAEHATPSPLDDAAEHATPSPLDDAAHNDVTEHATPSPRAAPLPDTAASTPVPPLLLILAGLLLIGAGILRHFSFRHSMH